MAKRNRVKNRKKNQPKKNADRSGAAGGGGGSARWVDLIRFEEVPTETTASAFSGAAAAVEGGTLPAGATAEVPTLSLISWNVLAEAYCSRRSQRDLPKRYARTVFDKVGRRERVLRQLDRFAGGGEDGGVDAAVDVVCLQEVDTDEIGARMRRRGYVGVETPRTVRGNAGGGKCDSCAIYVRGGSSSSGSKRRDGDWTLVDHELVRLDDLATLSTAPGPDGSLRDNNSDTNNNNNNGGIGNIHGLQQSFLRRNVALLAKIRHKATGRVVVVANAHLFWNPLYEYVKLCQTHYILLRARRFGSDGGNNGKTDVCGDGGGTVAAFVLCGDLNSRPHGAAHTYLSRGSINAKAVAPWYAHAAPDGEEIAVDGYDEALTDCDGRSEDGDEQLVDELSKLSVSDPNSANTGHVRLSSGGSFSSSPKMRYLLDATLNKFCRWLRILGQDTALETEEEERVRTGEGKMVLFERARNECRTLVTTSTRLMLRSDCPGGAYCINPTFLGNLEVPLVHMLLMHGVVLEPSTFLTRCVVCNGSIGEVHDREKKKSILKEYEAPETLVDVEVFQCDGCQQGYWWCDRPTSSASRVKTVATELFETCLRAGLPYRGGLEMFDEVDVEKQRRLGIDFSKKGSDLLARGNLDIIEWLRDEKLSCPFELESVYAFQDDSGTVVGEAIPFTNVTSGFIDVLDFVFTTPDFTTLERLYVPKSFKEMNTHGIKNGHLLPSDLWPSDHLAIGARLSLTTAPVTTESGKESVEPSIELNEDVTFCMPVGEPAPAANHGSRCDCGCVPNVLSLFEMAELRKQAKLRAAGKEST